MNEKWIKKGFIFKPNGEREWQNNSFLTPQPFLLTPEIIRVYGSFRDSAGVGRIGYVDLNAANPSEVLAVSETPVLDIGLPGRFDDNGVILGDVLRVEDKIYMYYVAFQLVAKVKFYAFSGLAIGTDASTFTKVKQTPVMDRSDEGVFGRCIHSVLFENNIFKVWYSTIYDWKVINGIPYPVYDIKYTESSDGIHFPEKGITVIQCAENEYRIGRPKVNKHPDGYYEMRYTSDTVEKEYKAGYAISQDGIKWKRCDEQRALYRSNEGFDSEMACYPVVLTTQYGKYMFYDGNGMGKTGFGYMEMLDKK